jgi:hypothetical protein
VIGGLKLGETSFLICCGVAVEEHIAFVGSLNYDVPRGNTVSP